MKAYVEMPYRFFLKLIYTSCFNNNHMLYIQNFAVRIQSLQLWTYIILVHIT